MKRKATKEETKRKATDEETEKLFNAVENNDAEFIKKFFDENKDVDINSIKSKDRYLPILHESVLGAPTFELLDTIIKCGVNVNAVDERGMTSLHYAANNSESEECVKDLIKLGANTDIKDPYGYSPLEALIARGKRIEKLDIY